MTTKVEHYSSKGKCVILTCMLVVYDISVTVNSTFDPNIEDHKISLWLEKEKSLTEIHTP